MASDEIRTLTRAEVGELVEWIDGETSSARAAAEVDMTVAFVAVAAKLREIMARPVLEWVDIPGQQAAQAGLYFVGLGADGLWRAAWDRRMVGDTYDTLEAAKAACEEHARGQG